MRTYWVYILASANRCLYIGSTRDLARRLAEHRSGVRSRHAHRYRITNLVYYESTCDARGAVARERQLKGWLRARKVALIEASNPEWRDLSVDWHPLGMASTPPRKQDPSLRSG